MNPLQLVMNFAHLAEVVLMAYLFVWTIKLRQSCACAANATLTVISALILVLLMMHFAPHTPTLRVLAVPFIAIYLIATFKYIQDLEKESCACSEGQDRTLMKNLAIWQAVVFSIVILIHTFKSASQSSTMVWSSPTTPFGRMTW